MGILRTKAVECRYKEYDSSGLNDNVMIAEILKEVATLEDIRDATVNMYCYVRIG